MTDEQYNDQSTEVTQVQVQSIDQQTFIERRGISPVLFAILALALIFVLYQFIGGVVTFVLFGLQPTEEHVAGLRIVTGLGQIFLILIPTLLLVRLATASPKPYLRLRRPDLRAFIWPLLGIFSLQQLLQIYLVVQERIPLPDFLQGIAKQFKEMLEEAYKLIAGSSTIPELLFVMLIIAFVPAIVEELLFRGLVQRSLEHKFTPMKSTIVTGIIFGMYHLNPFSFVPLAIIGIYLGFLAMRANSILVSMAAHFYNNAMACISLYLNFNDDAVITGNPEQMSAGMLGLSFAVLSVIFVVSTYLFIRVTAVAESSASDAQAPV